ncbi:uncharacterized protein LOC131631688 [Vicia villosa]|uniref:uncharacterized protein LOC131631688 n=1 Tax=Vicia villosa TaxID=3911 RepID=UPI00273A943F|nr:uncharacterized protein LOC131631688 [Vicia villosa]
MVFMLNQFLTRKPTIWRFVCFVSSIVGLLCFALSSSFNNLFGNWNFFKVFLYTIFSFIICLTILFANTCQTSSTSIGLKAHLVFSVFTITRIYSFFFDKANGKPDSYSLISCAAFAIMSLSLSKQTHFGFEVDLLYFFCGYLTLQLMKIKLFLVVVGVTFSYFLTILRFYLGNQTESGQHRFQIPDPHSVVIQLNLMKKSDPMAPNVESMRLFNIYFSDICRVQNFCFIVDKGIRESMQRSVTKFLLPQYKKFIGRFKDVHGKDVFDMCIKYGMSDIEDGLNYFFRGNDLVKKKPFIADHNHNVQPQMQRGLQLTTEYLYHYQLTPTHF